MQWQYWYTVHRRAVRDARNALWIETKERFMIALLLAIIALALIWLLGGREIAGHELIVQIALTAAVIVAFPFVYCWKLMTSPAKMQAEADDRIKLLEHTQATLTLSGPHLHNDHRFKSQNHWRMRVYNAGPAAARNVQMKLRSGAPEPKDSNWTGDYPYPIYPVGTIKNDPGQISSIGRQINTNDDERYEITCCWKAESGQIFTDINTKGGGHNDIQINTDERWKLSYEVTAENASPIRFVLEIFINNSQVTVAMVT
jgi:hypothetical protein